MICKSRLQGTVLCRVDDIEEGGSKGIFLEATDLFEELLLIRRGAMVYAYRSHCPHTGAPLNWLPDRFLDIDGQHVVCAIHGALFRVEDGYCLYGRCVGASLPAVNIAVAGGEVRLLEALVIDGGGTGVAREPLEA